MRELVVKYLNKQMSRRSFVGSLTKAGITMTAAQGVLASVSSVSVAQTGPAPAPAAGAAAAPAAPATAGQATAAVVRSVQGTGGSAFAGSAHRVRREIRVRQFRERGHPVL